MGDVDGPRSRDELERAHAELAKLRRLLAEGRQGASPEWVAAAEEALADARRAVIRAGGDPDDLASPADGWGDATDPDGREGAYRLGSWFVRSSRRTSWKAR